VRDVACGDAKVDVTTATLEVESWEGFRRGPEGPCPWPPACLRSSVPQGGDRL
jgi:hypothetical protein